ncbi:hypothetical protein OEB99_13400 [Actinotalea sp. M2MS4P-6]|uniref:hypothetical protein n=1 Tax=Actinotalea sp. M2MS4P-6 TaxID=2983762 RepID=UPI0021E3643B|nr:hypothetical protein [Actinotalea sp. M2MS4P-6]MCV2395306.1 hypothetical protein [Actinotalea sp. M2MS4P-6]
MSPDLERSARFWLRAYPDPLSWALHRFFDRARRRHVLQDDPPPIARFGFGVMPT